MNYLIKDADVSHVDEIYAIECECFSDPWTKQNIISQLPDENHVFLVALDGETVIGYVGMVTVVDEGYIANVAVTEKYRRNQIGDSLIIELKKRAEDANLAFVTLEVRESNEPAKTLYAKHGFEVVGIRKGYYSKPKENAVLMTVYLKGDNE